MPEWQARFAECAPELEVRWWDDASVAPGDVRYVLVWQPEPGRLASYPNLRLVMSSAAGVDHVTSDPAWPAHLPLVRMGGEETGQRMGEFVCLACLALLRDFRRVVAAHTERRWEFFETPQCATDVRVGVMGLGNLGARAATMLAGLGFVVSGWSRTPKVLPGVTTYAGEAERDVLLRHADMLVCLLPDTPETRGAIRAETIALLPRGAAVVNAARGSHVVLPDLIAALDEGHLSGAVLDVFDKEPVAADHPVWLHPRITITPHIGSLAGRRARAAYAADVIRRFEAGEALPNLYDPIRGY